MAGISERSKSSLLAFTREEPIANLSQTNELSFSDCVIFECLAGLCEEGPKTFKSRFESIMIPLLFGLHNSAF